MAIFKRGQNQATQGTLPPEIQSYTQTARRERLGIAWLVGVLSIVILSALLFLLFMGGRWAYRKITDNNKNTPSVIQDKQEADSEDSVSRDGVGDQESGDYSEDVGDANIDSGVSSTEESAGEDDQPTYPVTGDSTEETLPRTGPDLDL